MKVELRKWTPDDREDLVNICNNVPRDYLSNRMPYPYTLERRLVAWQGLRAGGKRRCIPGDCCRRGDLGQYLCGEESRCLQQGCGAWILSDDRELVQRDYDGGGRADLQDRI